MRHGRNSSPGRSAKSLVLIAFCCVILLWFMQASWGGGVAQTARPVVAAKAAAAVETHYEQPGVADNPAPSVAPPSAASAVPAPPPLEKQQQHAQRDGEALIKMRISDWRKEEETAATAAAAAAVSVATPHLGEGDTTPSEPTPHVAEAAIAEVIPAAAAAAAAGQGETPLQTTTAGQEGPPPPGQEDLELASAVVKPYSSPKEGDAEASSKQDEGADDTSEYVPSSQQRANIAAPQQLDEEHVAVAAVSPASGSVAVAEASGSVAAESPTQAVAVQPVVANEQSRAERWHDIYQNKAAKHADAELHVTGGYDMFTMEQWDDVVSKVTRRLPLEGKLHVHECGCGSGAFIGSLKKQHPEITLSGVDYVQALVDIANKRLGTGEGEPAFKQGDIRSLPFLADNFTDRTVSFGVFQYLNSADDARKATEEMFRITKPGGSIAIMEVSDSAREQVAVDLRKKTHGANYDSVQAAKPPNESHLYLPKRMFTDIAARHGATVDIVTTPTWALTTPLPPTGSQLISLSPLQTSLAVRRRT